MSKNPKDVNKNLFGGAQATGLREARVGLGGFRVGPETVRRVGKYRANDEGGHNTTEAQGERILLGPQGERGSERSRGVGESESRIGDRPTLGGEATFINKLKHRK
ncbi:hypothetical protein B0H16DRAFT_1464053 [Mycena metata]|uniref:Uncharacterized protein n=1 Tax=Mycena metata TaxID=1033252 RepID=A0AAD7N2B0_9AGAR|nr:hypothetical protein B0H16DRAFT_1464053 [Mycena metata]